MSKRKVVSQKKKAALKKKTSKKKISQKQTQSEAAISLVSQPAEFFRELICAALNHQRVSVKPHTEFYLVDLLGKFMFAENLFPVNKDGTKQEQVLALLMAEAMNSASVAEKQKGLQRLGDVSLYTAGFFSDSLSRKVVDVDYYIGMGRTAYGNLAQIQIDIFREVFLELAQSFHRFVDVLAEVRKATSNQDPKNILRLYELWLKTRSEQVEKTLKEAGIIPNKLVKPDWQ